MANTIINPKIFGGMTADYLEGKGKIVKIAKMVDVSEQQGDTVVVPKLKYLGDATEVVNGVLAETDIADEVVEVKLKQYGFAIKMTDVELSASLLDRNITNRAIQTAEGLAGQLETAILALLAEEAPEYKVDKIDKDAVLSAQGFFGAKWGDRKGYIICNSVTGAKLQKGLLSNDSRATFNTIYDAEILTVPQEKLVAGVTIGLKDDVFYLIQEDVIEVFKKGDVRTEVFRESGFVGEKARSTALRVPAIVTEDRVVKVVLDPLAEPEA